MLGLKLNHVGKRGHRGINPSCCCVYVCHTLGQHSIVSTSMNCYYIDKKLIKILSTSKHNNYIHFSLNETNVVILSMVSSNGNIFCITGPLCREFTGHLWIPLTKAIDAELLCFIWSAPEQKIVQTIETLVILDTIVLIMKSLWCKM